MLLHCKSLVVFLESPELVCPIIEELKLIYERNLDDFEILKYLVKTMIGYKSIGEVSYFESKLLK